LWQYFFVAAASHGFLHAMTNGGRGVAVLRSELIWIWIPTGLLAVLTLVLRRVFLRVSPKTKNVTDV